MNIGVPKEKRPFEFRVGLTPTGVEMLCQAGHTCYIEHDAGIGSGFSDQDYLEAGGRIAYADHEVFARADLLLKVARPVYEELQWLRPGAVIAGLLHLGSTRKDKIDLMCEKGITAVAYENITLPDGSYPVRRPLSQIGGRLAAQIAARLMQNDRGGKGILLGGEAGIPPAEVVIVGAGVAGTGALHAFAGMGAHLTVLDTDLNVLQRVYDAFPRVVTMLSYPRNIQRACAYADIVVGSILVPGGPPPKVITREIVQSMKPRALIMDISIDEGGCVETSRPTTHEFPTFIEEGIVHYCVPNIPSVVARTSTYAYLNAAFPFILDLANKGVGRAVAENSAIESGTAIYQGNLRHIAQIDPHIQGVSNGTE